MFARIQRLGLGLVFAVAFSSHSSPATLIVDSKGGGDHRLIQEAIDAAREGGLILVRPGG